jgi:hypothetical protein
MNDMLDVTKLFRHYVYDAADLMLLGEEVDAAATAAGFTDLATLAVEMATRARVSTTRRSRVLALRETAPAISEPLAAARKAFAALILILAEEGKTLRSPVHEDAQHLHDLLVPMGENLHAKDAETTWERLGPIVKEARRPAHAALIAGQYLVGLRLEDVEKAEADLHQVLRDTGTVGFGSANDKLAEARALVPEAIAAAVYLTRSTPAVRARLIAPFLALEHKLAREKRTGARRAVAAEPVAEPVSAPAPVVVH